MAGGLRGVAEAVVDAAEEAVGFGVGELERDGVAEGFGGGGPLLLLGVGATELVVIRGEALVGGRRGTEEGERFGDAALAGEEGGETEAGVGFSGGCREIESLAEGGFGGGAAEGVEGLATGGEEASRGRGGVALEGGEGVGEAVERVEGAGPEVAGVRFFRVDPASLGEGRFGAAGIAEGGVDDAEGLPAEGVRFVFDGGFEELAGGFELALAE